MLRAGLAVFRRSPTACALSARATTAARRPGALLSVGRPPARRFAEQAGKPSGNKSPSGGSESASAGAAAESTTASYMRTAADYSRAFTKMPNSSMEVLQYMQTREDMRRIMNEILQNRSRRLGIAVGASACGLLAFLFLYGKETKKAVVEEISDVASRSLGDEKMQAQAQLVTIQTLQALLEHGETVQRSVAFLSAVADHEQSREALITLLVSALKSPSVVNEALELVLWVLDDARCREHLVDALIAALQNERFLDAAAEFATRWIAHEDVRATVADTFKGASLEVLEDAPVLSKAEEFVQGLLTDSALQAKTSEHLWAAVKGLVIAPKGGAKVTTKAALDGRPEATPSRSSSADEKMQAAQAKQVTTAAAEAAATEAKQLQAATAAADAAAVDAKQLAAAAPSQPAAETPLDPLESETMLRRRQSEAVAASAAAEEAAALAAAPAPEQSASPRSASDKKPPSSPPPPPLDGSPPAADTVVTSPPGQTAPPAAPTAPPTPPAPAAPPAPPAVATATAAATASAVATAEVEIARSRLRLQQEAATSTASPPAPSGTVEAAAEIAHARRLQEPAQSNEPVESAATPPAAAEAVAPTYQAPKPPTTSAATDPSAAVDPANKPPTWRRSWRDLGLVRSALGDPS